MDRIRNFVAQRSFLWLFIAMSTACLVLFAIYPPIPSNEQSYFVVFFCGFSVIFLIQAASGWALDAQWRASIDRSGHPYSYWWRTMLCGIVAAGSAYRIFFP